MGTPDRAPLRADPGDPADLAELCRQHDIRLELLGRVRDVDELIDAIVRQNEQSLDAGEGRDGGEVRALVKFAARASAIDSRARTAAELRERSRELEVALDTARAERERLEDVLRTVGALCHKINNPLTALLGRVQLLRARGGIDPDIAKSAQSVEESAQRIAELVRELAGSAKDARAGA